MINFWKREKREREKKDIQTEWNILKLKADMWNSVKSSGLSLDAFRLLFIDQIFEKFLCVRGSKGSVEYLFQNTWSSFLVTGLSFRSFQGKLKAV